MEYIHAKHLVIVNSDENNLSFPYLPRKINGEDHTIIAVPQKYWKPVQNNYPEEMSQAEKDVVDQSETNGKDITMSFDKLLKSFSLVVLDEINLLRVQASLSERSIEQLKSAVSNKYDNL